MGGRVSGAAARGAIGIEVHPDSAHGRQRVAMPALRTHPECARKTTATRAQSPVLSNRAHEPRRTRTHEPCLPSPAFRSSGRTSSARRCTQAIHTEHALAFWSATAPGSVADSSPRRVHRGVALRPEGLPNTEVEGRSEPRSGVRESHLKAVRATFVRCALSGACQRSCRTQVPLGHNGHEGWTKLVMVHGPGPLTRPHRGA